MGHPPLMYRPAGGEAPPVPPDLEIRLISDGAGLKDFVDTLIEGYPMPGAEGTSIADPAVLEAPSGCSSDTSTGGQWPRPAPASVTA